jgi:hypothetical protein
MGGARDQSAVGTWRGRAIGLRAMGWGLAVLYKPRIAGDARRMRDPGVVLTRSHGASDGYDAVAQWRLDRMPAGGTCFLDATPFALGAYAHGPRRHRPRGWLDYYTGWVGAVIDSGVVQPGTCCEPADVPQLAAALVAVYRERHRAPNRRSFWLAAGRPRVNGDEHAESAPSGATSDHRTEVWETSATVVRRTYGGFRLAMTAYSATTPDPSFHPTLIEPASLVSMLRPGVAASVSSVLDGAAPSSVVSDARVLMEACLAALGLAGLGGGNPFPYGIGDVEIQLTERDGAAHASIRVSGKGSRQP